MYGPPKVRPPTLELRQNFKENGKTEINEGISFTENFLKPEKYKGWCRKGNLKISNGKLNLVACRWKDLIKITLILIFFSNDDDLRKFRIRQISNPAIFISEACEILKNCETRVLSN